MVQIEILRWEGFYYGKQTAIAEFKSFLIARLQVICLREQGSEFVFVLQTVQIKMIFFIIHLKCKTNKIEVFGYFIFLFNLEYHPQVCSCSCPSLHCPDGHDFWRGSCACR